DIQFRTLNISNFENEDAPNNIDKTITTIVKYYSKKGDSPTFTFKLLTKVSKAY
ncbi:hypothetical protein GE21DRAFT_1223207, partial [Neurospora crassa]